MTNQPASPICRQTKPNSFDYCHLDHDHTGPHRGAIGNEWPNASDRDHAGLRIPCTPCAGPCTIDDEPEATR